jgi:hypothetical protein
MLWKGGPTVHPEPEEKQVVITQQDKDARKTGALRYVF